MCVCVGEKGVVSWDLLSCFLLMVKEEKAQSKHVKPHDQDLDPLR